MDVKTFKKLFVHRSDNYAIQRPGGGYIPAREDVDDVAIQAHLDGDQTIGLYQVMPEVNTLKWAVLDIDIKKEVYSAEGFKLDDWLPRLMEQAIMAKERFTQQGIPSYIEFSGFKGYHVWAFFDQPAPADTVKRGMTALFRDMTRVDAGIDWELFPKQPAVAAGGMGNLVKGPCGLHLKSKVFSNFHDEVTLETVEYANVGKFMRADAPYLQILRRCSAVKDMWDRCLAQRNAPNHVRYSFGLLFLNTEGGRDFLKYEFFAKMENYNEATTDYHLDAMEHKIRADKKHDGVGYIPITCAVLQGDEYQGMCPKKCKEIERGRSPIAFYHWEKQEDVAEDTAIDPLDFFFKVGNAYYERIPAKKDAPATSRKLSSFVVELNEHRIIIDGIADVNKFCGIIRKDGFETEFEIAHDDFSAIDKLRAVVYKYLGPDQLLIQNVQAISSAINKYSKTEKIEILRQFGYDAVFDEDGLPTMYRSPSVLVDKNGVRENDEIRVELTGEEFAENLDLSIISDEDFQAVKTHIKEDLLPLATYEVTTATLAYTFLPIIFPFMTGDKTRFAFFVRGESGKGKSFLLNAFQNFYGTFEKVASWSSTPNSLGRIGYFFKDSLFLVDDWKKRIFNKLGTYDAALTLLQNFADNTARSRMTATMELAKTYVIRGWLAASGEDTPTGEASNLARMIPVTLRTKERDIVRGKKILAMRHLYSGFTARFIHHIFNINPVIIDKTLEDFMGIFEPMLRGRSNDVRIARNMSLMATSFKFISEFVWSKKAAAEEQEKFFAFLTVKAKSLVAEAAGELASERFVSVLNDLLSTGRVRLQHNSTEDVDEDIVPFNVPVIGYWGKAQDTGQSVPYIMPTIAYNEVQRFLKGANEALMHTKKAIIAELWENGLSYDQKETSRTMNKRSVGIIRFKPGTL